MLGTMRSVVLGVAIFAAACDAGRAPVPAARPLVSPTRDASLLVAAPRDASLLTSHAAITGCEERLTPPPTAACAAPPADVVKRATALVAASSAPDGGEPTIRFGCELSSGWLVDANFFPSPAFHDGIEPPCPPAAGYCGVDATWILPPSGDARLLRGAVLDANLDVDGDGVAESVTHADGITTVWFDAGRKPVRLTHAGGPLRSTSSGMNDVPGGGAGKLKGRVGSLSDLVDVNARSRVQIIDEGRPVGAAFDLTREMTGAICVGETKRVSGFDQQRSAQGRALQNISHAETGFARRRSRSLAAAARRRRRRRNRGSGNPRILSAANRSAPSATSSRGSIAPRNRVIATR